VRFYVMGERAVEEQASPAERQRMAEIVGRSIDRGAFGFSTNRYAPHKLPDGRSIPGTFADPEEPATIARAVGPRNALMQAVGADFGVLQSLAKTTRGRVLFSYGAGPEAGSGQKRREALEKLCAEGCEITAITQVRGSGFMFGLQASLPVRGASWSELRRMSLEGRLAAIGNPGTVARLVEEARAEEARLPIDQVFYLGDGDHPDSTAPANRNSGRWPPPPASTGRRPSFGSRARAAAKGSSTCACSTRISASSASCSGASASSRAWGMREPTCRRSWMRGGRASCSRTGSATRISTASPRACAASAPVRRAWSGLRDRGTLQVGMRADLNVFNPEKVAERQPELVHDFPGGAPRYIQRATGYKATLVNGQVNLWEGELTGVRAGSVLRHVA
jgi:hypothetical protein